MTVTRNYPALKFAINGVEYTFTNFMDDESGRKFAECFNEKFPGSAVTAYRVDVDVPDARIGARHYDAVDGELKERESHD